MVHYVILINLKRFAMEMLWKKIDFPLFVQFVKIMPQKSNYEANK